MGTHGKVVRTQRRSLTIDNQQRRDDLPEQSEQHSLLNEIEKDVYRLKGVAERFGKIGSKPELKPHEIAPVLDEAIKYMERRLPKIAGEVNIKTGRAF